MCASHCKLSHSPTNSLSCIRGFVPLPLLPLILMCLLMTCAHLPRAPAPPGATSQLANEEADGTPIPSLPPSAPVNGHWASCFLLHFFSIRVLPEVLCAYLGLVWGVVVSMCPHVGACRSQRTLLSTISRALFTSFLGGQAHSLTRNLPSRLG